MLSSGIIAKYGYKYIAFLGVLLVFAVVFELCWELVLAILVVAIFMFRNPKRTPNSSDEYAILSPIDGKIKSIRKIFYFDTECIEIVISKSTFGVGVIKSPCDMKLEQFKKRYGLFLCNAIDSSNSLNQRALYICQNGFNKFAIRILAGAMSRGLCVSKFDTIKSGEEFGFISSGRVVLILPANARISVAVGDSVKSNLDLIGFFNYEGER